MKVWIYEVPISFKPPLTVNYTGSITISNLNRVIRPTVGCMLSSPKARLVIPGKGCDRFR